jgi:excinuclease UvrABC nuclease subunit
MPFNPFLSRTLTAVSVRANAPAASGVYALTNSREWIYIGKSDNIQASLLSHLQESDSVLMKKKPTGFVFELCDAAMRPVRQDLLVFEYEPVCNRTPLLP